MRGEAPYEGAGFQFRLRLRLAAAAWWRPQRPVAAAWSLQAALFACAAASRQGTVDVTIPIACCPCRRHTYGLLSLSLPHLLPAIPVFTIPMACYPCLYHTYCLLSQSSCTVVVTEAKDSETWYLLKISRTWCFKDTGFILSLALPYLLLSLAFVTSTVTDLSDQAQPSSNILRGAYYLQDRYTRPKVW